MSFTRPEFNQKSKETFIIIVNWFFFFNSLDISYLPVDFQDNGAVATGESELT
jgi:hypothetical protein